RAEEEARAAEEAKRAEEEAKDQASYYYSGWVNTSILNIRDGADGNIIGSARKGAWLEGNASGDWLEIDYNGGKGYVSLAYISDTEVEGEPVVEQAPVVDEVPVVDQVVEEAPSYQASGMDVVNIASQFQGYPYVWGASSPSVGFDCSGLTSYAYGQLGISIPHHSASQYASGYAVNYNNLMPGDLVFFSYGGAGIDHVGIVTSSDGTFIHASTPATGVRYDNVYNGSFANHYVGARRIF
ncbi:MAG: SH3 domain-containing C40 family peptidase, partial [Anaerococcus sp.]|nr:SH3 domain-containing C40 family peptidase [Anaerococcus sp.]